MKKWYRRFLIYPGGIAGVLFIIKMIYLISTGAFNRHNQTKEKIVEPTTIRLDSAEILSDTALIDLGIN